MEITLDGLRLHASTGGQTFDPEKPAIVFLHGAGMDHTVWALQSRYFAHRGYGVLALDLPGHGRSEGTALATIEDWADWTARFIEAAGLKQAALVGHSMGSLIALATAARHPERVRALALLGVAARMPVHPDLLEAAENNDRKAAELISSWGFGPTGHIGGTRLPGLYLLWGGERLLEKAKPGSLFADLSACNDFASAEAMAATVSCPTTLVLGALDKMTPARAGQKLAALIPGAEATVIPAAGHMMMLEKPDETLEALKGRV
jgi:pimeloyl-ACP methyl ester carboxylesterase